MKALTKFGLTSTTPRHFIRKKHGTPHFDVRVLNDLLTH
jgi:hypothetical protein